MSFLEGIGAAVGIGATGVGIRLDTPADAALVGTPVFGALETITGEVVLTGGNVTQRGRLSVAVVEWWMVSTGKSVSRQEFVHSETILAEGLAVDPSAAPQRLSFALTLPHRAPIVGRNWEIRARFDVEGVASDRMAVRGLELIAPAPVRGLIVCLREVAEFSLHQCGVHGLADQGVTFYDFTPPRALTGALDGVKVIIQEILLPPAGDVIRGELDINPQERRVSEYLKGGRPHEHRPFSFPATVLSVCAPGGGGRADTPPVTPPNQIVVAALRDLLYPFLTGGQQGK